MKAFQTSAVPNKKQLKKDKDSISSDKLDKSSILSISQYQLT